MSWTAIDPSSGRTPAFDSPVATPVRAMTTRTVGASLRPDSASNTDLK